MSENCKSWMEIGENSKRRNERDFVSSVSSTVVQCEQFWLGIVVVVVYCCG